MADIIKFSKYKPFEDIVFVFKITVKDGIPLINLETPTRYAVLEPVKKDGVINTILTENKYADLLHPHKFCVEPAPLVDSYWDQKEIVISVVKNNGSASSIIQLPNNYQEQEGGQQLVLLIHEKLIDLNIDVIKELAGH